MSKAAFVEAVSRNGVYTAALMANIAGVSLTQVQLWLRSMSKE